LNVCFYSIYLIYFQTVCYLSKMHIILGLW